MNKLVAPKNFVAKHKTALTVAATATVTTIIVTHLAFAVNGQVYAAYDKFLKNHDLLDDFEVYIKTV